MKTVLVIYSNTVKENVTHSDKKYCFITDSDVKVGDLLKSQSYTTNMQVVKVIDEQFKFFNHTTGEMSNTYNSTLQWEIKELKIITDEKEVVTAVKIN